MKKKIFSLLIVLTFISSSLFCLFDVLVPHSHNSEASSSISYFNRITDKDIKNKMENKEEFFVYFGFDDCSGCVEFTPKIIEVSSENIYPYIYYMDPTKEENLATTTEYGVVVSPTVIFFKNGKVEKRLTYAGESEEELEEILYGKE